MFGGPDRESAFDGFVEPNGDFSLVVNPYGVRHLLVVGKDNQALHVIGFDVTLGKVSDVGVVDLSGKCPVR
jgi:hypothetical protein